MITQPYPSFIDPEVGGRAKPVSNGTIFIGQNQKDAIQFPEKVYYTDSEGTEIEMAQPIHLNSAGVTVASKNSPNVIVRPYTKSASYSILIRNSGGNNRYINESVSGFASSEDITEAQNEIIGGSIFKGSNGETVEVGDTVPTENTHLRVLVGGEPTIVTMSPDVNGFVSALSETGATIGGVNVKFSNATLGSYFDFSGISTAKTMVGGCYSAYGVTFKKVAETGNDYFDFKPLNDLNVECFSHLISGSDATLAFREAVKFGVNVVCTEDYSIETFDQSLSDGINCSIKLPLYSNITCLNGVKITGVTGSVTNSIFGCDTENASVDLSCCNFGGENRFRAYHGAASVQFDYENLSNIKTDLQSVISLASCKNRVAKTVRIGLSVTPTTPYSPTLTLNPVGLEPDPEFSLTVDDIVVYTGTEDTVGALVVKRIPEGGVFSNSRAVNLGESNTEGFDIDGVGTGSYLTNLYAYKTNIEYKNGTVGYANNKEVIADNWVSWECAFGASISIRSSISGSNFLSYDPRASWAYFIADLDNGPIGQPISMTGIKYVYKTTTTLSGIMRIVGTTETSKIVLSDVQFVIDPETLRVTPSTKIPFIGINIGGSDWEDISINGLYIDKCTENQILVRADTTAKRLTIAGASFGDTDDSCLDIANIDGVSIQVDHWPENIGDRAIRASGVNNALIDCPSHATLVNTALSSSNSNFVVNGIAYENSGAGSGPDGSIDYPIGVNVVNIDDNSAWLRYLANGSSNDFIKIGV